ncbi:MULTISPECIES: hypothetical protein [unclassified Nocardioides]|uniref:hypothetical protein n=1 Tax=unclassified Nocardioides TaxID=2615069 RepID=UPI0006F77DB7|nr:MULTISPECIES: hypothetical protein [unclassified Nocardioides]KQY50158.1 hypothetical protein ASD30_21775 [Nocardioides sp. Root140]KQZ75782.1 hypothetical protein ASD66_05500 [Nocardioides sp. Root151]KRF14854.1 hypothetical protein ASH02_11285 [Nocardioides sp. Soil796]
MSEPSELSRQASVIPYVDFHTGATRLLSLNLTTGNGMVHSKYRPLASIDGRQYVVVWGLVSFEIPADRNVHVSVHLEGDIIGQAASLILPPGDAQVRYTYETHYGSGIGSLTPA